MQRVSAGMAQNAVLAICAALWLGVTPGVIQQRLTAWRPAKWRGELRREGGRLLYLDCYNANPASMADALENFASLTPAGQPRAYVLGCMEELGPRGRGVSPPARPHPAPAPGRPAVHPRRPGRGAA